MLKCIVFGGNGFIGSHLVDSLLSYGHYVKIFDRSDSPRQKKSPNLEIIRSDLSNTKNIETALQNCDICFHLISTVLPKSSNLDPIYDIESNLVNFIKLLNQFAKAGLKKIIFLSSGGTVYGLSSQSIIDETHSTNPLCSYGITKLAIEKYLHLYKNLFNIDYTILRISNAYGERQKLNTNQGAIAVFLKKALLNEVIEIWGDGSIVRDYIHVSDIICAIIKSISYEGSEKIFNIGSSIGLSLNNVLDQIAHVTQKELNISYKECRAFDVPFNVLCTKLAKSHLDWEPRVTFQDGLLKLKSTLKVEDLIC